MGTEIGTTLGEWMRRVTAVNLVCVKSERGEDKKLRP
jgi:hypothetical protein